MRNLLAPKFRLAPIALLGPLSSIYSSAISLREALYRKNWLKSYSSSLPVICFGNATVGGSGKSPLVQFAATSLFTMGFKPVVLCRGYAARITHPHVVKKTDLAEDVGDEALMHRRLLKSSIPVVIAKNRASGVKLIEAQSLGSVIILDDGLQHLSLKKSLSFLLLDISSEEAINRWQSAKLLPAGWLRESLEAAYARSDAVIFVNRGAKNQASTSLALSPSKPEFGVSIRPGSLRALGSEDSIPLSSFSSAEVTAVCSIANPQPFIALLRNAGLKVSDELIYPDHYSFSKADILEIDSLDGPVICTEKDAVKLEPKLKSLHNKYSLGIETKFSSESEQGFLSMLVSACVS